MRQPDKQQDEKNAFDNQRGSKDHKVFHCTWKQNSGGHDIP